MPVSNVVVVAFAFSKNGLSNLSIAKRATELARSWEAPIFTQKDVARYIPQKSSLFTASEDNGYLSTFGIVRQLTDLAKKAGWTRVIVVAAPSHEGRCIRDIKKMGFGVMHDYVLRLLYPKSHWYHRQDRQFWVRNPLIWWAREIVLRILPWSTYRRIAA